MLVRVGARSIALQELTQQLIGVRQFAVVQYPNLADISGQFPYPASEEFATHNRFDALRFKIAAYQMRLGSVARGIQ